MRWPLLGLLVATFAAGCGEGTPPHAYVGPALATLGQAQTCATGTVLQGADVSSYQGTINWAQVKAAGLSFSIAKASEGTGIADPDFQANWSGMKANGIVRGAYHFFHSSDSGATQADYFLQQVGTFAAGDLPPFLDWEVTDSGDSSATAITEAQNFINEIQARTGLTTIIYTDPGFWTGLGNTTQFGAYPSWIANWGVTCPDMPSPWTNWLFWQDADNGTVNGMNCPGACDLDEFNGDLSQLQQIGVGGDGGVVITPGDGGTPDSGTTLPATVLPQESGNDAITLVNWTDEHMDVFAVTSGGTMENSATTTTGDSWSALATLDTGAECGSAAAFWGAAYLYPELYSPLSAGGAGHLWWTAGTWNTYQTLGGSGLSHLATVVWPSGLVEVFALGSDGAAWHDYFDTSTTSWVGWASLGGSAFSQGPRPLVWADGHGELYEVDSSGDVWRSTSASGDGTDWTAFAQLGSGIASRLSPVRWPDGTVELFGRGTDGNVWRDTTTAGAFGGFTMLVTQQTLGEPSAFMNPGGGAEVVARDPSGNVLDIAYSVSSGSWPTGFSGLGQVSASDAFAWIRGDGNAEVFAVDASGNLVHNLRSSGNWGSWGTIGTGLDACAPAIVYVDGGTPPVDAGTPPRDGGMMEVDAGQPPVDAGEAKDAGEYVDAGQSLPGDGGEPIADSGTPTPTPINSSGCGCASISKSGTSGGGPGFDLPLLCLGALVLLRRRKRSG
jgi:lysozyme